MKHNNADRQILLTVIVLTMVIFSSYGNVYVVIYATANGKTGHAGIAVDNYHIIESGSATDTVRINSLTYFDVWPEKDEFHLFDFARDQKPVFYVLPNAIWSEPITVQTLYDIGIPHREHYPCDAILKLPTTPSEDYQLIAHLYREVSRKHRFNPRFYNCSDFVLDAINHVTNKNIRAKEFIPFSRATTPNKLYSVLVKQDEFLVVKKAPSTISRSFLRERILKRKSPENYLTHSIANN